MSDLPTPKPSPTPPAAPTLSKQLNKEAQWSIYLTLLYLVGWVVGAYFAPDGRGLFGFPLWFELSCVFLPIVFMVISFAVLKGVYQDIDLDTHSTNDGENANAG